MADYQNYCFLRYLSAKKSIDDLALNRSVWDKLVAVLPENGCEKPLRILEVGAGIGTMVERIIDWKLLTHAQYWAVDMDESNVVESRRRLSCWAQKKGFRCRPVSVDKLAIETDEGQLVVFFYWSDIYEFFSQDRNKNQFDLVIAHAFMDLVDIEDILANFCVFLKAGGLLYLTLNYDGETVFLPTIEKQFEDQIMVLYHQSMDKRRIKGKKAGDSRTGRHLFQYLQRINAKVLAAGSSDWVVYPRRHNYRNDEAYFLHFIIETIDAELRGNLMLDSKKFEAWVQKRHTQIESGQITYIAKQIDFLARVEGKGSKHNHRS